MNEQTATRRVEFVHGLILALSMFLVGLYFGTALPAGVDLVVLQAGLIGFLSFLGLTQIRIATEPKQESPTTGTRINRSQQVERRLDRHVARPEIHRIDHVRQAEHPASVKKSSRTAGAISTVAKPVTVANRG
jgi:hypothetical protein